MINKNKFIIMLVTLSVLFVVVLAGCSQTTETEIANNDADQINSNIENNSTIAADVSNKSANNSENTAATMPDSPNTQTDNITSATVDKQNSTDKTAPAKAPTPIQSTGANDMVTFVQIRGALNADKELGDAVIVELKEGNVVLTGNVANVELKQRAEEITRKAKGIKSVKNNIKVSP